MKRKRTAGLILWRAECQLLVTRSVGGVHFHGDRGTKAGNRGNAGAESKVLKPSCLRKRFCAFRKLCTVMHL
jgi:hypothetical protein